MRSFVAICFTIATLPGPGACCCTLAMFSTSHEWPIENTTPTPFTQSKSSTKKHSCCCQSETQDPVEPSKAPSDPAKCPCKHVQSLISLLAIGGQIQTDIAVQIQQMESAVANCTFGSEAYSNASTNRHATPPLWKPAGRTLLTHLSLLRC
jgi:hypothetical protein